MANDRKKRTGFFSLFKKNKVTPNEQPQVTVDTKVDEYKGIPAEFLVSRGLENTTGLPKIDALGSYDDQFDDLSANNNQVITKDNITAVESSVTNNQENNLSSVIVAAQEEKNEPEIIRPDEPIYVENSNNQTVNYEQNINNNEQQVAPSLNEFFEPQINQESVSPYVDQLYNEGQVQENNNSQGFSR